MKKITAVLATASLALGGVALVAAPASAHTPSHTVDCSTLSVNLVNYKPIIVGVDGVDGQEFVAPSYESQPNPDYVASSTGSIDHPAVTHTEYEFAHKWDILHLNTKWQTSPNWNAESNGHSVGWEATGQTRDVVDKAAWTETIEHPAIGEPTVQVEVDPGQPEIASVDAIEGKANTVVVTVDGAEVENVEFGESFTATYSFDQEVAHDWTIEVVAYDNAQYNYSESGTTTPCVVPPPALCEVEGTTGNVNAAGDDVWWEIHFGRDAATQNEPALWNGDSYGGFVSYAGYDDKPVKHLGEENVYIHMPANGVEGANWQEWTFADGTVIRLDISDDTCNPVLTWTTNPPVIEEPPVEEPPVVVDPPVVEQPPVVTEKPVVLTSAPAKDGVLAYTADTASQSVALGTGIAALLLLLAGAGFVTMNALKARKN